MSTDVVAEVRDRLSMIQTIYHGMSGHQKPLEQYADAAELATERRACDLGMCSEYNTLIAQLDSVSMGKDQAEPSVSPSLTKGSGIDPEAIKALATEAEDSAWGPDEFWVDGEPYVRLAAVLALPR